MQNAVRQKKTRFADQTQVKATHHSARARQKQRDVRRAKRKEDHRRYKGAPERWNKTQVAVERIVRRGGGRQEVGGTVVANESRGREQHQLRERRMDVEVEPAREVVVDECPEVRLVEDDFFRDFEIEDAREEADDEEKRATTTSRRQRGSLCRESGLARWRLFTRNSLMSLSATKQRPRIIEQNALEIRTGGENVKLRKFDSRNVISFKHYESLREFAELVCKVYVKVGPDPIPSARRSIRQLSIMRTDKVELESMKDKTPPENSEMSSE
jgi:hypothetical protein